MNSKIDKDFIRELTLFIDDELVPDDTSATAELIKIKIKLKLKALETKYNSMRLLQETHNQ